MAFIKIAHSNTAGNVPAAGTRQEGELWVNLADGKFGYIDANQVPQVLLPMVSSGVWVDDVPPANPSNGDLWYDTDGTQLYIYYVDPTSSQWVIANNMSGQSANVSVSANPPAGAQNGDLWYDSVGTQLYVYYTDPTSSQWVIANTASVNLDMGVY